MSKFLQNIFGIGKSEKKQEDKKSSLKEEEILPPMVRRLSVSKSGRLKEKKKSKINLLESNLSRSKSSESERHEEIDKEIFDTQGVLQAAENSHR